MPLDGRTKGLLIALFGMLTITPDAVLVRYLSSNHVEPWTILFWRMLFSFPISAFFALYDLGGYTGLRQQLNTKANRITSIRLWAAAAVPQVATNIGFIFAFVHTTAAHTLLLVNLNPLWCAVAGRLFLCDTLPVRTIVALILAMGCMLITFVPEIVNNDDDADDDDGITSTTKGNMIAFVTGFSIAMYISLVRKGAIEGINMTPVSPMAAVVAAILSVSMQQAQILPVHVDPSWEQEYWKFWLAMMAEGTIIGIVFIALVLAPRLITGAELMLVLLLEVILGPLWVFWAYEETPSVWTLIGGLSLVTVLALHEIIPLIFHEKPSKDADDTEDGPEKNNLTTEEPEMDAKESVGG